MSVRGSPPVTPEQRPALLDQGPSAATSARLGVKFNLDFSILHRCPAPSPRPPPLSMSPPCIPPPRVTGQLLGQLLGLILLSLVLHPAQAEKPNHQTSLHNMQRLPQSQAVDPELRARLLATINELDGFEDRFDAEVWLVDMQGRLKKQLPDREERLTLLKAVHQHASRAKLPPQLVLAVIDIESRFDHYAISKVGAVGLMQIMPFWLKELNRADGDLFDINTNLAMGTTILRYYLDKEKGNISRALARYNGSLGSNRYPARVLREFRRKWQVD